MVPHRFSSSLSMGLLVLPFVTVKAGLLSGAGKAAPLLRVRVVKAGRCRLVKKRDGPRSLTVKKPRQMLRYRYGVM
jgi:hypothetical protein